MVTEEEETAALPQNLERNPSPSPFVGLIQFECQDCLNFYEVLHVNTEIPHSPKGLGWPATASLLDASKINNNPPLLHLESQRRSTSSYYPRGFVASAASFRLLPD